MLKYVNLFVLFILMFIVGCAPNDDDEEIPVYQEAIYIMDDDGSNKTKVLDVDNCENVQFIPNSNKLLYLADNSLYTVNLDGSENVKISGDLQVRKDYLPAISKSTSNIAFSVHTEERDFAYSLYNYNFNSQSLEKITIPSNASAKDAIFITYDNSEYLLYVAYVKNGNGFISEINLLNLDSNEVQTLYSKNVSNDFLSSGFSNLLYDEEEDKLFTYCGSLNGVIYCYGSLFGGQIIKTIESKGNTPHYKQNLNNKRKLIIYSGYDYQIRKFDYLTETSSTICKGYNYISKNDLIIFTDNSVSYSTIYSYNLDTNQKLALVSNSKKPNLNEENNKICFIRNVKQNKSKEYILW